VHAPEDATLVAELRSRVAELPDGLDAHLAEELPAIRARWPHGPAPGAGFAEFLAARISPRPRTADLYLAWWCSSGDAAGIAAFEALFDDDLRHATAGFRDLAADELRQLLRIKLFVGTPGAPPKIRDYAGRGSLQGWLRVTAVRTFVDVVRATRSQRYERELDEAELLGLADPQGKSIGSELGAAVKKAFAEAVARLAPRQRVFLRHAYVDHHTLDQIATHYAIHRATVARTLAAAREQLIADTRAGVAAAVGVAGDELSSVIRALESHVELSLSRVLGRSELRRY
jgi:RNA polymerase sigma-70 factor (ECF subfamily)